MTSVSASLCFVEKRNFRWFKTINSVLDAHSKSPFRNEFGNRLMNIILSEHGHTATGSGRANSDRFRITSVSRSNDRLLVSFVLENTIALDAILRPFDRQRTACAIYDTESRLLAECDRLFNLGQFYDFLEDRHQ